MEELYRIFLKSTGVTTDTRKIAPGNLFFALSGENFDGNAFAAEAIEKGCSYAVVDNPSYVKDERYILVNSSLQTLQDLARYHRKQLSIPIIGITGSNGKTTTKELIAAVLAKKYRILFTEGNLNNHIGVPLTMLRISKETEIAIIEMGANHQNEIEFLCSISMPSHGIITNIGKAHLEGFGGFEGVKKTKNELYVHLIENEGTVFYNAENPILSSLLEGKKVKKIPFGNTEGTYCGGTVIKSDPFLELEVEGNGTIKTQLAGRYNMENVLAAVTFGNYFGVSFNEIKTALEQYTPSNQRSQLKDTGKNLLLMDYYNANPSSMEVALENFGRMGNAKKAVVLGDMLELGTEAEPEHKRIAGLAVQMQPEMIILVGPVFCSLNLPEPVKCFRDSEEARSWIGNQKIQGYTILLKGSRGIKLERVADVL